MPTDVLEPPAEEKITLRGGPEGCDPAPETDATDAPISVRGVAVPAEVWAEAVVAFGDVGVAADWFSRPHPRLGDRRPADLIRNGEAGRVQEHLGRLNWGVMP